MKKQIMTTALMCILALNSNAQFYGGEEAVRFPVADLYDQGAMNAYLRAYAETSAKRQQVFDYYSDLMVDAYYNRRWNDVIKYGNQLLPIAPLGQVYYMRGRALDALGDYKAALKDYKAGKKAGSEECAMAYKLLKARMKEMRRR